MRPIDNAKEFPLHKSAAEGRTELVEAAIARGVDVNSKDTAGETALHKAAVGGHRYTAELLLAQGANPKRDE